MHTRDQREPAADVAQEAIYAFHSETSSSCMRTDDARPSKELACGG
jgi:hypothetical protein